MILAAGQKGDGVCRLLQMEQPPRQQRQNGRVRTRFRSVESAGSTRPPPWRDCGPTKSDDSTDCEVLGGSTPRGPEQKLLVLADEGDAVSVYGERLRLRNRTPKKSTRYGSDYLTDYDFEDYVEASKLASHGQLLQWGRKRRRTESWSSYKSSRVRSSPSDPERMTNSDDFPEGGAAKAAQGEARPCEGSWVSSPPSSDDGDGDGDGDWEPSEDSDSSARGGPTFTLVNEQSKTSGIGMGNISRKRQGEILPDNLPQYQTRETPMPTHPSFYESERQVNRSRLVADLHRPPRAVTLDPQQVVTALECMDQFVHGGFSAPLTSNASEIAERPEPSQNCLRDVAALAPRDGFAGAVPNEPSFSDVGSVDSDPQSSDDDYLPPTNSNVASAGIIDSAGNEILNSVSSSRRPRRNVASGHDDMSRRTSLLHSNSGAITLPRRENLPSLPTRGFDLGTSNGIYACRTPIPLPCNSPVQAKILLARGNVEPGQPSNGTPAPNNVEEPKGKRLFDLNEMPQEQPPAQTLPDEVPQEQPPAQTLPQPRKKLRPKVFREGRPYRARKPKNADGGAPKPKPPRKPRAKPGSKAAETTNKTAPRKKSATAASRMADGVALDNQGAIGAVQFQGKTPAPPSSEEVLVNREENELSLPPRSLTPVREALQERAAHCSHGCGFPCHGASVLWDIRTGHRPAAFSFAAQASLGAEIADEQKLLDTQKITRTSRRELFGKPRGKGVLAVGKEQGSGLGQTCRDSLNLVTAPTLPVLDDSQMIGDPSQYAGLVPIESASVLLETVVAETPAVVAATTDKPKPKRVTRRKPAAASTEVTMDESNPKHGRDASAPAVKAATRRAAPRIKRAPAKTKGTRRRGGRRSISAADLAKADDVLSSFEDLVAQMELKMAELQLNESCSDLQIVPYATQQSAVVPFVPKKVKLKAKVLLSDEDKRLWELVLSKGPTFAEDDPESEESKRLQKEREIMKARAENFINRMHLVQGDRRFSVWGGSVVDSVVGAFLTQNVSDHLSSSAFMALAARFPVKKETRDAARPSQETSVQEVRVEEALEVAPNSSEGSVSGNSSPDVQVTVTACNVEDPSDVIDKPSALKDLSSICCSPKDPAAPSINVKTDLGIGLDNIIHSLEGRQGSTEAIQTATEWNGLSGELPLPTLQRHAIGHGSSALEEQVCASLCAGGVTNNFPSAFGYSDAKDVHAMDRLSSLYSMQNRELVVELNIPGATTSETGGGGVVEEKHNVNTQEEVVGAGLASAGILSDAFVPCRPLQDSAQSGAGVEIENFGAKCVTPSASHNFSEGESFMQLPSMTSAPESGDAISKHISEYSPDARTSSNVTQTKRYMRRKIPIRKEPLKVDQNFQDNSLEYKSDIEDAITSKQEKRVQKPKRAVLGAVGIARGRLEQANITSKVEYDWEAVRQKYLHAQASENQNINREDAVDWEAVRTADLEDIAAVIKERGMNFILAGRIKAFLERLHTEHGSLNLEWLRKIPTEDAKSFLLSIRGLGLKSVECIRLLCLLHLAFPVDTNVGRLVVRLGWVPLEPLPDSMMLHLLEMYPIQETVQKYLWPRLCNLDQKFLYELHYQMITFGKVFCTKSKPNCNACPIRDECKHFASALSSAKLPLPAPVPEEPHPESSIHFAVFDHETTHERNNDQLALPDVAAEDCKEVDYAVVSPADPAAQAGEGPKIDVPIIYQPCEPIVEEPVSPPRESFSAEPVYTDIVDLNLELGENVNVPGGSSQWSDASCVLRPNMEGIPESADLVTVDDSSKALVLLPLSSASLPVPKLKNVGRLRTVHYVYELPDNHPLVEEMYPREHDDPCFYLLAIWSPGETPEVPPAMHDPNTDGSRDGFNSSDAEYVKGTILIPCRTAMQGKFPLNGTYFQVNEVFADHASSVQPIEVPRVLLWNLRRRFVYFGTSVTSIFRGFSTEEIQACFWRGYVCVRGFDRLLRSPMPLAGRLHAPPKTTKRQRRSYADDE